MGSLNLKLAEGAALAAVLSASCYELYRREDTEIIDSTLPFAITWSERQRRGLKTLGELKKLGKKPKDNIPPTATARVWDEFKNKYVWIDLYGDGDIESGEIKDKFITKSSLKQNYLLSEGWVKRIGEPNRYVENPHSSKSAPMQWFSSHRVEAFLAEHAEEYARWLVARARKVEIYEENRETIQAGAEDWRLLQWRSRRANRNLNPGNELNLISFLQNHVEQDKKIIEKQISRCLCCASGCAFNSGFLCAVHPNGPSVLPCPDYARRHHD